MKDADSKSVDDSKQLQRPNGNEAKRVAEPDRMQILAAAKSGEGEGSREIVQAFAVASRFSGPLPPPDLLRQYEEVLPGAAERIFTRFEKREDERLRFNADGQRHSHSVDISAMSLEEKAAEREYRLGRSGQICALIFGFFTIGGSLWVINNHPDSTAISIVAGILGAGGLTSIVLAFLRVPSTRPSNGRGGTERSDSSQASGKQPDPKSNKQDPDGEHHR